MSLLFRLATAAARRLPRRALDFLVGGLLLRAFFRHPVRRAIILANYRRILAFSGVEASPERLDALLEETRPLYSKLLIGMLAREEDIRYSRARVDIAALLTRIEEARRAGRGAIVAFSNFGNFSYTIMALFQSGIPLKIPVLRRETLRHLPHGWGDSFLTVEKSSRECLEALARNEVVIVITMVNYMARRPTCPLFGAPARLAYAPARLAQASGAPILPAFTVFSGEGYRVLAEDPIPAPPRPEDVEAATAALARVQENIIARHPAQWHVYDDFWNTRWMDANYRVVRWLLRWL